MTLGRPASASKTWLPDWRTAFSALLIVAAFPPLGWSFLIWFCLVPWLWAITESPRSRRTVVFAVFQGIWLSVLMSCLGFYWVAYVLHEFGGVPWLVSGIGLLLYSLGGQPQFLAFGALQQWAPRPWKEDPTPPAGQARGAPAWLALAAWMALLYAGIDWTIPKLFKDTLGHSLYLAPWLRQAADLGGAHLLTFLIFWVNYALLTLLRLALAFRRSRSGEARPESRVGLGPVLAPLLSSALLLGLALAYGRVREGRIQAEISRAPRSVTAGVIQANIGDFDKVAAERGLVGAGESVINDYLDLSARALELTPRPDFLVWPETAYPSTFGNPVGPSDLMLERQMRTFVETEGEPILFGGYDRAGGRDFNTLFVLSPDATPPTQGERSPFVGFAPGLGGDLQSYHKSILLLFGEYVPFTEDSQLFSRLFPQVANFGRGPGPELVDVRLPSDPGRPLKLGPVICYEALFPSYVIDSARQGSDLILNITNDSWFGPYGEPILHLSLSVFRSIETRLPQLRSTNTGISALILQDGSIARRTGVGTRQIMNVTIPLAAGTPTLMKLWGDWFGRAAILLAALGFCVYRLAWALRRRQASEP